MKSKILNIWQNYKLSIVTALIVLLVGFSFLVILSLSTKNSSLKKIDEEYYSFQYDRTWKLKQKKKDLIMLKHRSGSKVTIQISELTDESKFSSIDDLIDELSYTIQAQNESYKLISKKEDKLTNYNYDGYSLLYENDKEQVMVSTYKKSDKLVTIRYEANNSYFDILLDSVHNIINHLNIKDKKFDLNNTIQLKTVDVTYNENDKFDKTLSSNETYEISNNNYYVKYSIPKNFTRANFDSTQSQFNLKYEEERIHLVVNIFNRNIYEYLDKEESSNVFSNYSYYHEKENDDYSDFKESISKLDGDLLGYIYKNSYFYNKAFKFDKDFNKKEYKRQDENTELIYALDNNHILVIKISSNGIALTKKLIESIKVVDYKNYANYIKIEKEDNYLIGRLQDFANYQNDKIRTITLKVPDKYEEIDKNANFYKKRYYGWNYNDDLEEYDYEVHYELFNIPDENIIKIINQGTIKTAYGASQELTYSGNFTQNDKEYKVYGGGYTDISGIMFTDINRIKYYVHKKVLIYNLSDDDKLIIEIDGNNKEINDEVVNELLNFTVEEKEI